MTPTVACVLPAYQAAATIGTVARALRRSLPQAEIVAIDDGSSDGTADVARDCCDRVIRLARNQGKGAALRAGFAEVLVRNAEVVVTIDSDGQHDAAYAPALVDALERGDLAVGARGRRGTSMPLARRVTNTLSARAMSALACTALPDPQSGFRAIRRSVLTAVSAQGDGYEFETDLLLRAARAGFRIVSMDVPTIYGAASHFRARDGLRVVRTIWSHRNAGLGRRFEGRYAEVGR